MYYSIFSKMVSPIIFLITEIKKLKYMFQYLEQELYRPSITIFVMLDNWL